MEFSAGIRSFHFHVVFPEDRIKDDPSQKAQIKQKLGNGTHIFHLEISFENVGLPIKKACFPRKFSFGEAKFIFPFSFQSKFPDFLGKW